MRLLFATRAMHNMAGGVERMITTIMNEMTARGHEVALLSWDRAGAESFYPIDARVEWYRLDLGDPAERAGLGLRLQRAPRVRAVVKGFRPDVIVAFQGGAFRAMLLYTLGLGVPVVAAERTAPSLYKYVGSEQKRQIELLSFRFAKLITVQFDRYRSDYPAYLQDKILETPNPVRRAGLRAQPAVAANGRFTLLSVGRLSYQKNFLVLLRAFEAIAPRFPDWDLRIVGEGEERRALEQAVAGSETLSGRVFLPGAARDVASHYAAAHLFCLPSRWEGFPNALAEALAHGLPSVGFAGCDGVPDLIEAGVSGVLAEGNDDSGSLAAALAQLMEDASARGRYGLAAIGSVEKYAPETCFDRWEVVLKRAAHR